MAMFHSDVELPECNQRRSRKTSRKRERSGPDFHQAKTWEPSMIGKWVEALHPEPPFSILNVFLVVQAMVQLGIAWSLIEHHGKRSKQHWCLSSHTSSFTVSVFWLMMDDETNMNLPVWGVVVSQKNKPLKWPEWPRKMSFSSVFLSRSERVPWRLTDFLLTLRLWNMASWI